MSSGNFQKAFLHNFTIFITLKGNKIILHHSLTKIDEIKLVYFLNKTELAFIDENGSTYIGALTIRITKET